MTLIYRAFKKFLNLYCIYLDQPEWIWIHLANEVVRLNSVSSWWKPIQLSMKYIAKNSIKLFTKFSECLAMQNTNREYVAKFESLVINRCNTDRYHFHRLKSPTLLQVCLSCQIQRLAIVNNNMLCFPKNNTLNLSTRPWDIFRPH